LWRREFVHLGVQGFCLRRFLLPRWRSRKNLEAEEEGAAGILAEAGQAEVPLAGVVEAGVAFREAEAQAVRVAKGEAQRVAVAELRAERGR